MLSGSKDIQEKAKGGRKTPIVRASVDIQYDKKRFDFYISIKHDIRPIVDLKECRKSVMTFAMDHGSPVFGT